MIRSSFERVLSISKLRQVREWTVAAHRTEHLGHVYERVSARRPQALASSKPNAAGSQDSCPRHRRRRRPCAPLSHLHCLVPTAKPVMTSLGQITRQLSALEISSKPNTTRPPTHQKKPSQPNVSKLLSKYAAPNPFPASSTLQKAATTTTTTTNKSTTARPASPTRPATAQSSQSSQYSQSSQSSKPAFDIGRYDGGFEIENETRGEVVTGEAAAELALDSSVAL